MCCLKSLRSASFAGRRLLFNTGCGDRWRGGPGLPQGKTTNSDATDAVSKRSTQLTGVLSELATEVRHNGCVCVCWGGGGGGEGGGGCSLIVLPRREALNLALSILPRPSPPSPPSPDYFLSLDGLEI